MNNVRPKSFDEIIGQRKAKEVLRTLALSSKKTGELCPSVLMSGPSGNGKTTMAYAFAKELNTNLFNVNASCIRRESDLIDIFKKVRLKDVVFIDEIHSLSKRVSESIYTILEDFYYINNGVNRAVQPFTCLGATTELGKLEIPLKNRFQFIAEFERYSKSELTDICLLVCKKKGFKLNKEIAELIANTCKGVPREVKNRTEWIYSYMMAKDLKSISRQKLLEIIALQGIDKNGLNSNDKKYLNAIQYGAVGIDQIAKKVNVDKSTIQNTIEPYLIEMGYAEISSGGREITPSGLEVIEEN